MNKKNTFVVILVFVCLNFLSIGLQAQSPQKMSYQAVIRDATNNLVISSPIGMRISILQGTISGSVLYAETQSLSTNSNGLVSLEIGSGAITQGNLATINWASGPFYIKTETDILGGTNYTLTGASQLMSVPFAFYAQTSGSSTPGPSGPSGKNSLVKSTTIPSGATCATGGVKLEFGIDANANSQLDLAEINATLTQYICNGTTGTFQSGTQPGEMLYWNGSAWTVIPPATQNGQRLSYCYGIPKWTWGGCDPLITTNTVTGITPSSATCGGNIADDAGNPIMERGVCIATTINPTTANKYPNSSGIGSFTNTFLDQFTPNTIYHVRAYAITSFGTFYGNEVTFTTLAAQRPMVETYANDNVSYKQAAFHGKVISDMGSPVTARGFCWGITPNPGLTNRVVTLGTGIGNIDNLQTTQIVPNTTYYVRAYATNSVGTSFGAQFSFTTPPLRVPIMQTTGPNGRDVITQNSVTNVYGIILDDGGVPPVIEKGFCYATTPNPTTANTKIQIAAPNTVGTQYQSVLNNLIAGQIYYVRAYGINSLGTGYGNEISFTTLPATLPIVTTNTITNIGSVMAIGGGNVTNTGGGLIAKGVCWSTTPNPTIANNPTNDGGGLTTGNFASTLTGLTPNTTYYVKAYATNNAGTSYGTEVTFATSATTLPIVVTNPITSNQGNILIGGGTITNAGGGVTASGVCWSILPNPTLANSFTNEGASLGGNFTSDLTGITPSTNYYIRAYATNSLGTVYGNSIVVTTTTHYIGENFEDGIIFYIFSTGDTDYVAGEEHGLIAAPSDNPVGTLRWNNGASVRFPPSGSGTAFGTGFSNTNTIVIAQGTTVAYAARNSSNLVIGVHSDWFLPSKEELDLMYENRNIIGGFATGNPAPYWSSTWAGTDNSSAYAKYFYDGVGSFVTTGNTYRIRSIRKF